MNPKFRRSVLFVAAFLSLLGLSHKTVPAQGTLPWTREELLSAARETMTISRYCALITLGRDGSANARTMDAFAPDEQMYVWLGTNRLSRKVEEIRRNPRVTLYYFDRETQAYVTIQGTATIVDDANEKARHWKDEWKDFYPNREDYVDPRSPALPRSRQYEKGHRRQSANMGTAICNLRFTLRQSD